MTLHNIPVIIQGGMGAAVSGWQLAQAVSRCGQLGVVSGTALDVVLARRLQLGDPGGHLRRALDSFPYPEIANRIFQRYFVAGGKAHDAPFKAVPMLATPLTQDQIELIVVANFVEVYLAREGHAGLIGINYLEKIQLPTLPSLFGAMLAGVDYVLMGAGIPIAIPGTLDQLSEGRPVELPVTITSKTGSSFRPIGRFDPMCITGGEPVKLERPQFLAIVASSTLATMLSRKANGRVDGFVVEGPTAGGHNAPPRGKSQLNARGEPLYGKRDMVDLQSFRCLDVPFWLAGSYGAPERLVAALQAGAAGVQVGTAFAFCDESGLRDDIKRKVLQLAQHGDCHVFTDPLASPTGFPFKVLGLKGSLAGNQQHDQRQRRCDLGFLRQGYETDDGETGDGETGDGETGDGETDDGAVGWRCPAEQQTTYVRKGGDIADTIGRKCLCNALLANVGLGQVRHGGSERPLVTCGDDVSNVHHFLPSADATSYSAADVIDRLLATVDSTCVLSP